MSEKLLPSAAMHGPYVVLNDWSTFSGADGCTFVYITSEEQESLEESNDFKSVDEDNAENVVIGIEDLIDAYNTVHGTNL